VFILLLRYLKGYIRVKIGGDFPERFINICAVNNIILWNIKRHGKLIYANISLSDAKKIRVLRRKSRVRIKIVSKRGLYFLVRPYLNRKGLSVGVLLFFIINIILSSFIWNVEVIGNKTIPKENIIEMCEKIGIGEGTFSRGIDTNEARLQLLMNNKELSWCSFIVEGSHLTVNISETDNPQITDNTPTNFIASSDGIVSKVKVSGGKAVVKKDQAVTKGELLATGVLEYKDGSTHFTKCAGEIIAETQKEITLEVPLEKEVSSITPNVVKRYVLYFFGIKIPLSYTPIDFEYEKSVSKKQYKKDNVYLPICFFEVGYNKVDRRIKSLSYTEALKEGEEMLKEEEAVQLKGAEIISYLDDVKYKNDRIIIKRSYKLRENIAISEKIQINTVN